MNGYKENSYGLLLPNVIAMSQMPTIQAKTSDLVIFGRLLRNGNGKMSPRLARYVLTLGFNPDDQARMKDLATRNQEGTLSAEEREKLMGYVKAGHLLALLHSQARRAMKKRKVS